MIHQLTSREKIFLCIGGGALFLLLLSMALIIPYRQAVTKVERQVVLRLQQLEDVNLLRARYQALQSDVAQLEKSLSDHGDFSPLTFLENLIERTAGRDHLVSMRPQTPVTGSQFSVDSVDLKLEKLTFRQVLELLWAVEGAPVQMKVKTLHLKQRFDAPSQLDASITITAVRRAT